MTLRLGRPNRVVSACLVTVSLMVPVKFRLSGLAAALMFGAQLTLGRFGAPERNRWKPPSLLSGRLQLARRSKSQSSTDVRLPERTKWL